VKSERLVATPIWWGEAPERLNVFEERLVLLNKAHGWTCRRAEPWFSAGPATPPNLGGSPTFHLSLFTFHLSPRISNRCFSPSTTCAMACRYRSAKRGSAAKAGAAASGNRK
jgi:hypothetical protein